MKTIIHIGQHKTGTTSIQSFLKNNRDVLIKKNIYIPSVIVGHRHPSHYILNVYALAKNRFSSKKEEMLRTKGEAYINSLGEALKVDIASIYKEATDSSCETIIWTNEGLYLLNSVEEYKKLFDLFSAYSDEVEVVCCFRDPVSYRKSYIEQLKNNNISQVKNQDSYRYLEPDSWLFNYERKKKLLRNVFHKCTFFSYDANDNVSKFFNTIDIDIDKNRASDLRLNITNNEE